MIEWYVFSVFDTVDHERFAGPRLGSVHARDHTEAVERARAGWPDREIMVQSRIDCEVAQEEQAAAESRIRGRFPHRMRK